VHSKDAQHNWITTWARGLPVDHYLGLHASMPYCHWTEYDRSQKQL